MTVILQKIKILFFIVIVSAGMAVHGQSFYSGRVIDLLSQQVVKDAFVQVKGKNINAYTNSMGEFRFNAAIDSIFNSEISIKDQTIYWNLSASAKIEIFNISGQLVCTYKLNAGKGEHTVNNFDDGIYILRTGLANGSTFHNKFYYNRYSQNKSIFFKNSYPVVSPNMLTEDDTLVISKEGYYSQEYSIYTTYPEFEIMQVSNPGSTDFLNKLIRPEAYILMESQPFNPIFSELKSIKIIYSIADDKIYYANSAKFFIHYDFAYSVLNYNKGHTAFNNEQYTDNPNRIYILATLNHFKASDIYTLDFFAGDELDCSQIEDVYNKIVQTTYIGPKLKFYSNNLEWSGCISLPIITSDELYAGQNYQPLNPQEAYGYLKKFTLAELNTEYAGRHDIVVLNGIPNDISLVAGIITTEFQTPLSHINVLSHNRGAPNMALRDGWTNQQIESLSNKLVYFKVTLDTFILKEASLADAQAFWANKEPKDVIRLRHDTITTGLVDLIMADIESDTIIGGKAANFSELMKIEVTGYGKLNLPEGAFAIPFYYYWQHMHTNSLDIFINKMLADPLFSTDFQFRKAQLQKLQDSIRVCPLDPTLLTLVNAEIEANGNFSNIRFRSSTNSEDIKGFNGAGLYDSYTGIPGDSKKTIEKAIQNVWASLWNIAAFEERDYFKIDQKSVAMAILVHRSFPEEEANGVVITKNIYNRYNPGYLINVQAGEVSITNPIGGYTTDEIIWYSYHNIIEYINHSNLPGMEGKTVMSDDEILELKEYCKAIQNHYCMLNSECLTMDIEFKIDLIDGLRKIYIKQARIY